MALKDLLEDAAKDPDIVRRLHTDPESVFSDYNLTADEIEDLKSGDKQKINHRLGGGGDLASTVTVISIIVVTAEN